MASQHLTTDEANGTPAVCQDEHETLVADLRHELRPTEIVDRRLREILGHAPLPHMQDAAPLHGRRSLVGEGWVEATN